MVLVMVVVKWCWHGGDSLCRGGSCNSCGSVIIKCMICGFQGGCGGGGVGSAGAGDAGCRQELSQPLFSPSPPSPQPTPQM